MAKQYSPGSCCRRCGVSHVPGEPHYCNEPQYTELSRGRKFKQIKWSGPHQPCQQHLMDGLILPCPNPGEFDSPTKKGPWADLCATHVLHHCPDNSTIGYHRIKS